MSSMFPFTRPDHTLSHRDDADTSSEAATSIRESARVLRERIYDLLEGGGPGSAEYVAAELDVTHLQAMKRLSDLKNSGLVVDTGLRAPTRSGRSQIIWNAVHPNGG